MIYRFKYNFLIPNIKEVEDFIGEKGFFEFTILSKTQKENGLLIEGIISFSRENDLDDDKILTHIFNYFGTNEIKLITKEDMVESITNKIFYHGTTEESFKDSNNYIYLTTDLSHAVIHAKSKARDNNEKALVVKVNMDSLNHLDFLPDNDIDESNGYTTVIDSYTNIGSILVVGNISCDLFEKISFHSSSELECLAEDIHRDNDDILEGDILERINCVDFYELMELPISFLDLDEWGKDDDLINEYTELDINSMPPIIVHEFSLDNYSIVDGVHRLNACHKKGLKTIKAYVGKRS